MSNEKSGGFVWGTFTRSKDDVARCGSCSHAEGEHFWFCGTCGHRFKSDVRGQPIPYVAPMLSADDNLTVCSHASVVLKCPVGVWRNVPARVSLIELQEAVRAAQVSLRAVEEKLASGLAGADVWHELMTAWQRLHDLLVAIREHPASLTAVREDAEVGRERL